LFKYPTNKIASARLTGVSSTAIGTYTEVDLSSKLTAIDIPSNSDLNDYKTPGYYKVASDAIAQSLSNCPVSNGGTLHVEPANIDDSRVFQKYRAITTNYEYSRALNSSGWTEWRIENIVKASGAFSSVELFDTLTSGFISNVTLSGTAKANLSFSGKMSFIVVGDGDYIHIICVRGNGEMYTRNKNDGTWDESWKQIQFVTQ
jgi:hypothetical protein